MSFFPSLPRRERESEAGATINGFREQKRRRTPFLLFFSLCAFLATYTHTKINRARFKEEKDPRLQKRKFRKAPFFELKIANAAFSSSPSASPPLFRLMSAPRGYAKPGETEEGGGGKGCITERGSEGRKRRKEACPLQ